MNTVENTEKVVVKRWAWGILALLALLTAALICGCASQSRQGAQQSYPCPSCGYKIDAESVNKNIRVENKCASCGKVFFYTPTPTAGDYYYYFGYRPCHPGCYRVRVYKSWQTTRYHWSDRH